MLRKLLAAALLASALGGCGAFETISQTNITQNQIDAARSAYVGLFLTPAAAYYQLGICPSGTSPTVAKPCALRAVVAKLQQVDAAVESAFTQVQTQFDSGDTSGVAAAYSLLNTAISTAEAALVASGAAVPAAQ